MTWLRWTAANCGAATRIRRWAGEYLTPDDEPVDTPSVLLVSRDATGTSD